MSVPFLLEIGTEEIPDWMIEPALNNLREQFTQVLEEHRLAGAVSRTDATPRRLVLRAEGLIDRQPDQVRTTSGPPVSAGPGAAQGFAKKMGVGVDQLSKLSTPKGDYWSYDKPFAGRSTAEVLAEALPPLIIKIYFPKTMYWTGKGGPRFIRPIRWIVALLGDAIVPFELAGVRSGNITTGHRELGTRSIPVTVSDYEQQLLSNGVILSAAERRTRIEAGLAADVKRDDALLDTLVYLTEYPTPIRGGFDPSYLELPQEILTTVMRHHQRYFSVQSNGGLSPEFVAVMNTNADPDGLVRLGNERVLRARFNDARFFWNVDLKRKLADRLEDLKNVTFQAKLGSYYEKTMRIVRLVDELALDPSGSAHRAAELCKCDLTTDMVKELTELQGVVGGLYARGQGEPEAVWRAIYEHYRPASMEDAIPSTLTGQTVALADKLDTLIGCFRIGLVPTGSKDPFALRRAAQGVIKIIVEGRLQIPLFAIVNNKELEEFLLDRLRYYFRDVRGYKYDEVNAVLASGYQDLVDVADRLAAVSEVRPTENFEPLAAGFKRIRNILTQAAFQNPSEIDRALLEAGPETALHERFTATRAALSGGASGYRQKLETIASIRPAVDLFFDKVLVNAPDPAVRANRLSLLHNLLTEFSAIADFSEIVTSS
jgi:glycyl-tRNA synthetase beta chain